MLFDSRTTMALHMRVEYIRYLKKSFPSQTTIHSANVALSELKVGYIAYAKLNEGWMMLLGVWKGEKNSPGAC